MVITAFNGAGTTATPTSLNLICFWLWQIPSAWALAFHTGLGPNGVYVAVVVSDSPPVALGVQLFRQGKWKQVRVYSLMPSASNSSDTRSYFAEERTFLAWIRTGIALMGFGFVVARFGLFLCEFASLRTLPQLETSSLTVRLGTALLVAGVLVNILSSVRHVRIVRALNSGEPIVTNRPRWPSLLRWCWPPRVWPWQFI
jgi:putative membrane protein